MTVDPTLSLGAVVVGLVALLSWVAIAAAAWAVLTRRLATIEERVSILWTAYLQAALDSAHPLVARPGKGKPDA